MTDLRLHMTPLSNQPFGHYWEVVHSATNEVVNSGFEKYQAGDKEPAPEVNTRVEGFVIRTKPVYSRDLRLEEAVRELLDVITGKQPGVFNEVQKRVEALLTK